MNTALLVLRLVPGLLFIGHGLQKLVPAGYSPPLLHATGPRAAAGFFEQIGLRPGLPSVFAAALAEVGGGFLIGSGLVTPLGTALIAAVMTTAILSVHIRKGIWNTDGGIELPLVLLTMSYLVSALGPGSFSIDSWAGIANWTGIHWIAADTVRAGRRGGDRGCSRSLDAGERRRAQGLGHAASRCLPRPVSPNYFAWRHQKAAPREASSPARRGMTGRACLTVPWARSAGNASATSSVSSFVLVVIEARSAPAKRSSMTQMDRDWGSAV